MNAARTGAWAGRRGRRALALSALMTMGAAQAADDAIGADARAEVLPMSVQFRFDPAHIDGGEHLGLVSTALLFEPEPGWLVGPAVVGAASGQRGGFFVLGGQVARHWRLAGPWRGQVSLMAGGGGGGGAPVGGGLMLVPAASLLYDWGGVQAGVSWSSVNMPSGRIGSQQLGLVLSWDGRWPYFRSADVGRRSAEPGRTGLGLDRMALTGAQLHVSARDGRAAGSVRLVGVRAEQRVGPHAYWGVEAAAATHGGADGYMELLGTGGWETSASAVGLDSVFVGVRAALGLGGGGAVDTGGGTLGKAAATLRWEIGRDAYVGVEAGAVRAGRGDYRGHYAQWQLGWQLDHPGDAGPVTVAGMAWSASVQHVAHAARKDGRRLDMDTVGVKLQRAVGEHVYLTGQAHSAVAGQAGAYSAGLAGVGVQTRLGGLAWTLSAELLAGAAGGGGVDSQGGAVAQGMVYLGRAVGTASQVQIGAGRIRSQHGGLSSPVIDISWTQAFGTGVR